MATTLSPVQLYSQRLSIRLPVAGDVAAIIDYYQRNRSYLSRWEPQRAAFFYQPRFWQQRIDSIHRDALSPDGLCFVIFDRNNHQLLGFANFSQIVMGNLCACYLGYSLDEQQQGKGYMQEALGVCFDHLFHQVGLNRIMANYIETNQRSAALLSKLGFEREGYAREFLKINGRWQDHVLTSLLRSDYLARSRRQGT